jgi:SAM-dependent methyltransferase
LAIGLANDVTLVPDGNFWYCPEPGDGELPRRIEINGSTWWRFMEGIYCPQPANSLSLNTVLELCDLRLRVRRQSVDPEFHRDVIEAVAIQALASGIVPRRIADLGCGDGDGGAVISECYPDAHIVGVDASALALTAATRNSGQMDAVRSDLLQLALASSSFELVIATFVFHFEALWPALREAYRVLASGGVALLTYYGDRRSQFFVAVKSAGLVVADQVEVAGRNGHWVVVASRT